jgi:hypothetical protein
MAPGQSEDTDERRQAGSSLHIGLSVAAAGVGLVIAEALNASLLVTVIVVAAVGIVVGIGYAAWRQFDRTQP